MSQQRSSGPPLAFRFAASFLPAEDQATWDKWRNNPALAQHARDTAETRRIFATLSAARAGAGRFAPRDEFVYAVFRRRMRALKEEEEKEAARRSAAEEDNKGSEPTPIWYQQCYGGAFNLFTQEHDLHEAAVQDVLQLRIDEEPKVHCYLRWQLNEYFKHHPAVYLVDAAGQLDRDQPFFELPSLGYYVSHSLMQFVLRNQRRSLNATIVRRQVAGFASSVKAAKLLVVRERPEAWHQETQTAATRMSISEARQILQVILVCLDQDQGIALLDRWHLAVDDWLPSRIPNEDNVAIWHPALHWWISRRVLHALQELHRRLTEEPPSTSFALLMFGGPLQPCPTLYDASANVNEAIQTLTSTQFSRLQGQPKRGLMYRHLRRPGFMGNGQQVLLWDHALEMRSVFPRSATRNVPIFVYSEKEPVRFERADLLRSWSEQWSVQHDSLFDFGAIGPFDELVLPDGNVVNAVFLALVLLVGVGIAIRVRKHIREDRDVLEPMEWEYVGEFVSVQEWYTYVFLSTKRDQNATRCRGGYVD